jgi:hypothetical protein
VHRALPKARNLEEATRATEYGIKEQCCTHDRLAIDLTVTAVYWAQMADQKDVRRIAKSLPGASAAKDRFAFMVRNGRKEKAFAWVWQERIDPKKARVPNPSVLAVRVADMMHRDMLLASDKRKFFTEPHYDGFPAVLVRLSAVEVVELRELITAAWRCQAPRALVKDFPKHQEK